MTPLDLSTVTDSRDIIERLEYLRIRNDIRDLPEEEQEELSILSVIEEHASGSADWEHGEQLIHKDYFGEYIMELVEDCYDTPEFSGWPFCHMSMDWDTAIWEAKQDYMEFDDYLIRA